MGYRCRMPEEKLDNYEFRMMELMMSKKQFPEERPLQAVLAIDNHMETLRFVQEHMNDFITNCIKVTRMEASEKKKVDESARLFERNLEPLFTVISATATRNILDKLSSSLKKALLLMAMEKYHCNKESVCKALGLTPDKLEREIALCGLTAGKKAA